MTRDKEIPSSVIGLPSDGDMTNSREYPARPIAAVGAIIRKDDMILLIQRGKPPGRGDWVIPGGAVEIGETWRDAARREVREECAIEIDLGEIVDAIDMIVRDDAERVQYHYAIVDFAAEYVSGELCASSDALDARWVPLNELNQFPLPDKTRRVIEKVVGNWTRTNADEHR
jgi:8-oxo-dGTP diphosphatase